MTQQTLTTSFLKHSQPLLTKCLQAALIAAPVMLASAPSHAQVITSSVNGFTGLFNQLNWIKTPDGASNTVTFTPGTGTATQLKIVKNINNTGAPSAKRVIDIALVDALRPSAELDFVGWKVTGKYTFTGPSLAKFDFKAQSVSDVQLLENTTNPGTPVTTFTEFSVTGDGTLDDEIDFDIARNNSGSNASATGTITDFKFEAYYENVEDVPGPLPIVGAAAAFAWSRKLRNRLKPTNTLV